MNVRRNLLLAVTAATFLAIAACSSGATATPTSATTTVNVTLGEWTVVPSRTSVNAGATTFAAQNDGALEHELIVLKTDRAHDALVVAEGKVDEAASGTLSGEIEPDELQPRQSASAGWDLESGKYVLFCNIVGHYSLGMHAAFTVN